jgi:LmbE family N-acetylglucosaminyl deacetylase
VIVLCASQGEAGSISDPALVPDGDLGRVRARELRDAAAVLGVAEAIVLNYPDGDLRWEAVDELHDEIVGAIRRYRPDAVITFAEDGLYWHLDHIGVHERTYTAVKSFGPLAPPLYYVTLPKGVMRSLVEAAHAKGGAAPNSSFWGIEPDAFGDGAIPATFAIDVRGWVPRKLEALRRHRTQMGTTNPIAWIDEEDARRWLGAEYFRRSPLESAASDSVLEQLGEPVASS